MSHAGVTAGDRRLLSAFGHTVPRDSLSTGHYVAEGEIIGAISGFPGKKTDLLPHLHLTFAWVPADISPDRLTWENLGNDPGIRLIDPLTVICCLKSSWWRRYVTGAGAQFKNLRRQRGPGAEARPAGFFMIYG